LLEIVNSARAGAFEPGAMETVFDYSSGFETWPSSTREKRWSHVATTAYPMRGAGASQQDARDRLFRPARAAAAQNSCDIMGF
jgi:hypothetical protein